MMAKMGSDNFKDCRFGEIDFGFCPVFKSSILHKNPTVSARLSVKSLKDLCIHKMTCYTEVSKKESNEEPQDYLGNISS